MDPRGTIGFEIRELSILLTRYIEKEKTLNNFEDIQGLQVWTLGYLYKNRRKVIFQKDIEREFSIRKSTTSSLVKRMIKNGFIEVKKGTQKDKRLKQLVLTDKAVSQIQAFKPHVHRLEEKITDNISPQELEQFKETLKKIKNNLSC